MARPIIVDSNNQVLYEAGTSPAAESDIAQHPDVLEALSGESGTTFRTIKS